MIACTNVIVFNKIVIIHKIKLTRNFMGSSSYLSILYTVILLLKV